MEKSGQIFEAHDYGQIEREYPPQEALLKALKHISSMGLFARIKSYGNNLQTYVCLLQGADGNTVESGYGKGIGVQSLTGAVMEALEYYYTRFENLQSEFELKNAYRCFSESIFSTDRPIDIMLANTDAPIALRCYRSNDEQEEIYWPLALTCPFYMKASSKVVGDQYDYSIIRRYSTNSGNAIGQSLAEAAIHGLCELIERDALSLFLLDTFISKNPKPIRVVDPLTLPEDLQCLLESAEQEIKGKIIICNIMTNLGIPAYLCVPHSSPNGGFSQYGSGASLSPAYALSRAVTELCQLGHLVNSSHVELEKLILGGNFKNYPALMRCSRLDVAGLIDNRKFRAESFEEGRCSSSLSAGDCLSDCLRALTSHLARHDVFSYFSINATLPGGLVVVSSLAPRLEKFNLVLEGALILPGKRGRHALQGPETASS